MLIRREAPVDVGAIDEVHRRAFASGDAEPVEVGLVRSLRADPGWIPALSLVAQTPDGSIVGHVVCTRGHVDGRPALGLGPIGVLPQHQRRRVGTALMHAVLGGADALSEPLVAVLGDRAFYGRFGFVPASSLAIAPSDPAWTEYFQVRTLTTYDPVSTGTFTYAAPFAGVS